MSDSATIQLTRALIDKPSVTPDDAGCQQLLAQRLSALGFDIEHMRFADVDNLWATKGNAKPLFVFAGHTDVVPPGPDSSWTSPAFSATIKDTHLYGRGAADMKGSIAAMIVAVENFLGEYPQHQGGIGFLITSDEEGVATDGTVKVIETLQQRNTKIDYCLVGEPSSTQQVGDVIKNGRRGSLGARLRIIGRQGHVAYPHLAENPIHLFAPALQALTSMQWDQGNAFFPPTTFQISNINSGTGATNVIPGDAEILFNFRFSTETTAEELKARVEQILDTHSVQYDIEWTLSGQPFLTPAGKLVDSTIAAIEEVCGYKTELSTAGGTSDGRFIAPTGAEVLELGPVNATIHQVNENVAVADLDTLTEIYKNILIKLLT